MPRTRMVAIIGENYMVKKIVLLIGVMVVFVVAFALYEIYGPPFTLPEAATICHAVLRDKWRETPDVEFTDDWKTYSIETSTPGWLISGEAFAIAEDGTKMPLTYSCVIAVREVRTSRIRKLEPHEYGE